MKAEDERRDEKLKKKSGWHKKESDDPNIPSQVMMIPQTPGGVLKKALDKEIKTRLPDLNVKIIEKPGGQLIQKLEGYTNKKVEIGCPDETKCLQHNTENGGNCRKKEIVYQAWCAADGADYIGETGRNGFSRSREHVNKAQTTNPVRAQESWIKSHIEEHHNGEDQEFHMKILHSFQFNPLKRRIVEGI